MIQRFLPAVTTKALAVRGWVTKASIHLACCAVGLLFPPLAGAASAASAAAQFLTAPSPGAQCRAAIAQAERAGGIPAQLLAAIGRVESGRRDPVSGSYSPWPWTVNAEGRGYFFDSKAEAIAAVRKMRADGMRSIDVGCMQVNLMHHPDAFASLEAAFDPMQNATYAAKFLNDLHSQGNGWPQAAALYHSANPELGEPYQRKVLAAWPDERRLAGQSPPSNAGWGYGAASAAFGGSGVRIFPVRRILPAGIGSGGFASNSAGSPANTIGGPFAPAGAGSPAPGPGRGLDAYRATPIAVISRLRRIGG